LLAEELKRTAIGTPAEKPSPDTRIRGARDFAIHGDRLVRDAKFQSTLFVERRPMR